MGFPENVLAKGERVERSLHPHWLTVVIPTLFGLVLAALCVVAVWATPNDSTGNRIQLIAVILLVLVAIPLVVVPYLRWRTTHYVITTHRVMVRRGILTKNGKDITLSKITDVSFQQTLLDRIIGAGSLHIESAGDSPDENLSYIPRSNEVQQLINRLIDQDDLRRRSYGRGGSGDDFGNDNGTDDGNDYDTTDDTRAMPKGKRDRPELAEE
ncbi:hypothetical protein GCM10027053_48670 [Intrasporangium mesophilum]